MCNSSTKAFFFLLEKIVALGNRRAQTFSLTVAHCLLVTHKTILLLTQTLYSLLLLYLLNQPNNKQL